VKHLAVGDLACILIEQGRRRRHSPSRHGAVAKPAGGAGSAGTAVAAAPPSPSLPSGTEVRHQVRSGDSLWQIASRYGTTVEQIRADNGLRGNALLPGQILVIRGSGVAPAGGT